MNDKKKQFLLLSIYLAGFASGLVFILLLAVFSAKQNSKTLFDIKPSPASINTASQNNETKNASTCGNVPNVWQFLPTPIKNVTYEKNNGDLGSATYELYDHDWSESCDWFAFSIELVGRDGNAYKPEDYKPRGIYIFNKNTERVLPVKYASAKSSVHFLRWFSDDLIFEEVFTEGNGRKTIQEYAFNVMNLTTKQHSD